MEDLQRILGEHPSLKGLDEKYIQLLVTCASNVVFKKGEYIFREGEPADNFYLIRKGKVLIEVNFPPKGSLIIRSRDEGELFGWSWLVPPYKWHFDARAVELTRAISIDGKCLRGKCEDDHDLGYQIMKRFVQIISERLEATRLQLMDIYGDDK